MDSLLELLDHSLTLQSLDCERVGLGGGNDECNDSHGRVAGLKLLVQAYFFDRERSKKLVSCACLVASCRDIHPEDKKKHTLQ